jgi:hypothetical protein
MKTATISAMMLLAATASGASSQAARPSLAADTAVYHLEQGVLQYAFTFANPSDSVLYLDCQLPPRAILTGDTLALTFARHPAEPGEILAGGPVGGGPADPRDFPPQRVAGGQTFHGQRKLDRVLGDADSRPRFSVLLLRMDHYPERTEGGGESFLADRPVRVSAPAIKVTRKGKMPKRRNIPGKGAKDRKNLE